MSIVFEAAEKFLKALFMSFRDFVVPVGSWDLLFRIILLLKDLKASLLPRLRMTPASLGFGVRPVASTDSTEWPAALGCCVGIASVAI